MYIPKKTRDIGPWAGGIVNECYPDLDERIQRGALYRNLYLTGDENGMPQAYAKTFEYIESLSAVFFSPVELRYDLRFHGGGNLTDRAMGRAVSADIHDQHTDAGTYGVISNCVKWSLVKGCSILKLNYEGAQLAPYMIQPEFFGVHNASENDLNRQEAFVHTTYYTASEFEMAFKHLDNLGKIMTDIRKKGRPGAPGDGPQKGNALKQIVLGGLNPYQSAGSSPASASSRGIVQWLGGPQTTLDPKVMASLFKLDELWVKDSVTGDYVTIQLVGDVVVSGDKVLRNAMADNTADHDNTMRRLPDQFRENNPLSYMHPFTLFSNPLHGYFYGRSEVCNVGVLQMQINKRVDGIGRLLRRQENPPQLYIGGTGINQQKYSAGDKPGAWFTDPNPNAKVQKLYPELPSGLWESLHEMERMFDEMSGRPPVMRGMGESGVRAQGHAETLTANASPRFKDKALSVERSVAQVGTLSLELLRMMDNRTLTAWLSPNTASLVAKEEPEDPLMEPPAPGMKQYSFRYFDIPDKTKVVVDSHSSSPIFGKEARQLIFDMAKAGMIEPEEAIEHIHPPGEDEIIADRERKQIEQAELIKQHPELLAALAGGGKKKRR